MSLSSLICHSEKVLLSVLLIVLAGRKSMNLLRGAVFNVRVTASWLTAGCGGFNDTFVKASFSNTLISLSYV